MKYVTELGNFQRVAFSIVANKGNKGVYFSSSTDAKEPWPALEGLCESMVWVESISGSRGEKKILGRSW